MRGEAQRSIRRAQTAAQTAADRLEGEAQAGSARAEVEALASGLEEASAAASGEAMASELTAPMERLRAAAAPPPPELMAAAEAFLAADHGQVVALLEGAELAQPRARAHRGLLLSAARFALWAAGGETDGNLLERARADARACHQLDPGLRPLETLFSRRFVDFFTRTTAP